MDKINTTIKPLEREDAKHFVYRHIRIDKNEPFYIGIGTNNKKNKKYKRSEIYKNRNIIWKQIVAKTRYKIEIIYESNDYNEIIKKEIEFISLYGRINNKTGILANMTDGGEGNLGWVMSNDTKRKISYKTKIRLIDKTKNPNFGIKSTKYKKEKVINSWVKSGKLYNFYKIDKSLNIYGPYININDFCKENSFSPKCIDMCFKLEMFTHKNFHFCKSKDLEDRINLIKSDKSFFEKRKTKGRLYKITNILNKKQYIINSLTKCKDLLSINNCCFYRALKYKNIVDNKYKIEKL